MFVHYSDSILNDQTLAFETSMSSDNLSCNRMTRFDAHYLGAAGKSVVNGTKVPVLLTPVS